LSRDRILDAAMALVDREGASSLTMRGVGAEVSAHAMSLYNHVRNKQDLLDGLSEAMMREVPIASASDPWELGFRGFAGGIRRAALLHPPVFELVGMRPLRSGPALAPVVGLLRRLRAAGMSPDSAMTSYRLVAAYTRGFCLSEIAGFTLATDGAGEPVQWPAELRDLREAFQASNDGTFERGLDLLVGAAAAAIETDRG
jgi:TetR/AcrR family tetracycline transcriptional repressor